MLRIDSMDSSVSLLASVPVVSSELASDWIPAASDAVVVASDTTASLEFSWSCSAASVSLSSSVLLTSEARNESDSSISSSALLESVTAAVCSGSGCGSSVGFGLLCCSKITNSSETTSSETSDFSLADKFSVVEDNSFKAANSSSFEAKPDGECES